MLCYRKFYITLSSRELRRRQWLTKLQIQELYQQVQKRRSNWQIYLHGLIRMQRVDLLLADVVGRKYCPESKQKPKQS